MGSRSFSRCPFQQSQKLFIREVENHPKSIPRDLVLVCERKRMDEPAKPWRLKLGEAAIPRYHVVPLTVRGQLDSHFLFQGLYFGSPRPFR